MFAIDVEPCVAQTPSSRPGHRASGSWNVVDQHVLVRVVVHGREVDLLPPVARRGEEAGHHVDLAVLHRGDALAVVSVLNSRCVVVVAEDLVRDPAAGARPRALRGHPCAGLRKPQPACPGRHRRRGGRASRIASAIAWPAVTSPGAKLAGRVARQAAASWSGRREPVALTVLVETAPGKRCERTRAARVSDGVEHAASGDERERRRARPLHGSGLVRVTSADFAARAVGSVPSARSSCEDAVDVLHEVRVLAGRCYRDAVVLGRVPSGNGTQPRVLLQHAGRGRCRGRGRRRPSLPAARAGSRCGCRRVRGFAGFAWPCCSRYPSFQVVEDADRRRARGHADALAGEFLLRGSADSSRTR